MTAAADLLVDSLMGLSTRHGQILSALRSLLTPGPGLRVVAGGVRLGG